MGDLCSEITAEMRGVPALQLSPETQARHDRGYREFLELQRAAWEQQQEQAEENSEHER